MLNLTRKDNNTAIIDKVKIPDGTMHYILQCFIRYSVGLSISRVSILGFISPFGVSYASILAADLFGICGLLGAMTGYVLSGGDLYSGRYIVCAICAYSFGVIVRYFFKGKVKILIPAVLSAILAVTGALIYTRHTLLYFAVDTLSGTLFSYVLLRLRQEFHEGKRDGTELILSIILSVVLSGLNDPMLFGVLSVGRAIATLILMCITHRAGLKASLPVAFIMGLIFDITLEKGIFFSVVYPSAVLISGICSSKSRFMFTVSYILISAILSYIFKDSYCSIPYLYEVFASSVTFMMMPTKLRSEIAILFSRKIDSAHCDGSKRYMAQRLRYGAEAFLRLYNNALPIKNMTVCSEDISSVYDRACDSVCRGCKKQSICWGEKYGESIDAMNGLTSVLKIKGEIKRNDVSDKFASGCIFLEAFLKSINTEYKALIHRLRHISIMSDNYRLSFAHYGDMYSYLCCASDSISSSFQPDYKAESNASHFLREHDTDPCVYAFRDGAGRLHMDISGASGKLLMSDNKLFDSFSDAVGMRLCIGGSMDTDTVSVLEAEPYSVNVGVSAISMENKSTGDTGRFFKTDEGIMYIILSDGLGTGKAAERMSRETIDTLELFLRSGLEPDTALKILSDHMLLMNTAEIYSATIDLMCIDLFSGNTVIYKSGAAPSYIKSGDRIKKLKCRTPLPGFMCGNDFSPDKEYVTLRHNDMCVIISDGIMPDTEDKWLKDIISCCDMSPRELSRLITRESMIKYGKTDDMTCICVKFTYRD